MRTPNWLSMVLSQATSTTSTGALLRAAIALTPSELNTDESRSATGSCVVSWFVGSMPQGAGPSTLSFQRKSTWLGGYLADIYVPESRS